MKMLFSKKNLARKSRCGQLCSGFLLTFDFFPKANLHVEVIAQVMLGRPHVEVNYTEHVQFFVKDCMARYSDTSIDFRVPVLNTFPDAESHFPPITDDTECGMLKVQGKKHFRNKLLVRKYVLVLIQPNFKPQYAEKILD